jgi:predicted secreted protein
MSLFVSRMLAPIVLLAGCVGGLSSQAQGVAVPAQAPAQLHLAATETRDIPTDSVMITLQALREGSDAALVQTQLKQAVEAALQEARPWVQPGQLEVRTGAFSLQPRYGREGKVNGWQGVAEVVIDGRDLVRVPAVAGRMTLLNVTQVQAYVSAQARQQVEAQVQQTAIERFRAKAADAARALGYSGYTVGQLNLQEGGDAGPGPRPRAMAMEMRAAAPLMADAPVPLEGGRGSVSVSVRGSIYLTR